MFALQQEPERAARVGMLSATGACALIVVCGALAAAASMPRTERKAQRVSMRIVPVAAVAQPAPAPEPPPKAEVTSPPKPLPTVRRRRTERSPKPPASDAKQPIAPTEAAAPSAPSTSPTPVRLGLSLSSMVAGGGGPAMPTGDAVHGAAGGRAPGADPAHAPHASPAVGTAAPVRREAELRTRVKPHYPREARTEGVEGVVVIALTIAADGTVVEARLLRGVGHGLDDAALTASRKTRWSPATVDGRPVRSQRRFNVRFTLDG